MKLREIMSRDVYCTTPDTSLRQAASEMRQLDVGALPICDDDRLVGMVTDRDLVIRGLADGRDPDNDRVREVMTPGVTWCYEDDTVEEAARVMQREQIRRLPVLDQSKRLVGIVSLGDLAVRSQNDPLSGHTLEQVSEPVH
jgi:CBS domain-containing protein